MMNLKVVDFILIVLIVTIGGGYWFISHKDSNCHAGKMQLSPEVKAFIDAELKKPAGQAAPVGGLKELSAKLLTAEKQFQELQQAFMAYVEHAKGYGASLHTLNQRRFDTEVAIARIAESLREKAMNSCGKSKRPVKK